jgi:hypothetical protein
MLVASSAIKALPTHDRECQSDPLRLADRAGELAVEDRVEGLLCLAEDLRGEGGGHVHTFRWVPQR